MDDQYSTESVSLHIARVQYAEAALRAAIARADLLTAADTHEFDAALHKANGAEHQAQMWRERVAQLEAGHDD